MRLNVDYEALKYAVKINNHVVGYTKEKARAVFGKYYYLVLNNLNDLSYNFKRRNGGIARDIISVSNTKPFLQEIKVRLYTAIREEQVVQQKMVEIELEFMTDHWLTFDDAVKLEKKYRALMAAQLSQRLKILQILGSPNYESLNKQWCDIKKEQLKNNVKLAQIAKLEDSNAYYYSKKIDQLYEEHMETKSLIEDNKQILLMEIDAEIETRFEELKQWQQAY